MNPHFSKPETFLRWVLFRVIHPGLRRLPRLGRRRRILLLCNGTQLVDYLSDVWELINDDQDLVFCLYLVHGDTRPGEVARAAQVLPVRRIDKVELYLTHWDLVMVADHVHAGTGLTYVNGFSWPTLFTNHGIPSGLVDGECYEYGKGCYDEKGRIRYTRILAASEADRRVALAMDPGLSEKVLVVGSLKGDRLVEMARTRDEIRHRLGIGRGEVLVLITSTYGPHCLFNMMGDALLVEIRRLSHLFRFALTIHPMEYRSPATGTRSWGDRLSDLRREGFLVADPGERWEPYLVASDVIVADHTSLALYGMALRRPYVYAPIPEALVGKSTLTRRLLGISPTLRPDASNLRESLVQALKEYPLEMLAELDQQLNSFPGEAKARVRQAVYELLN